MFFLKKIFQKKLNIEEVEDLLFESGVEPKFADMIITKIKDSGSKEDDLRRLIKSELLSQFKEKQFGNFQPKTKSLMVIAGNNGSGKTTFIGKFIQYFQQNGLKPAVNFLNSIFSTLGKHSHNDLAKKYTSSRFTVLSKPFSSSVAPTASILFAL